MAATFEPRGQMAARPYTAQSASFGATSAPTMPAAGRAAAPQSTAMVAPATDVSGAPRQARRRKEVRRGPARAHLVVSWLVLGGIIVQVFFAGLGIFTVVGFDPHVIFAIPLILGSFSLPILAHVGRIGRSLILRSWLLAGLMIVQGALIDAGRPWWPPVSSLHPVNALALVLVASGLARSRPAAK